VEDEQGKLVVQVVAILLCPALALAQPGAASGRIEVNGRTIELRHAYASPQPGVFDPASEDIRVLLTDVALAPEARDKPFQIIRLAREGTLHGVEVVLTAQGEPLSGSLFLAAFNGMASVSGVHRFDPAVLDRERVGGRLFMDGPRTFDGVTYRYDATFTTDIPRPPTPEQTAAALASPPAQAAAAHVRAIHGPLEPFLATLTSESAASFRQPGGASRLAGIRAETPRDSRVVALAMKDENTGVATVHGTRGDIIIEFFVELRRVAGAWKVQR
jgi:hypothetical protein